MYITTNCFNEYLQNQNVIDKDVNTIGSCLLDSNTAKVCYKNFTDNITAPMNIFSIIVYTILWISSIIVFFRHDSTFGDEEGDPINISFTVIALLSLIILFIKQYEFASRFITKLIQLFMSTQFSPYTILLHIAIILSILFGINITTTSLNKTGWNNNPSILAIFICTLVVIIFYIGILYYNYSTFN